MKKEIDDEGKLFLMAFVFIFIILLLITIVSAGWWEDFKRTITGKDTATVVLNISVGVPQITRVYNTTSETINLASILNEAGATSVLINFTVYTSGGAGALNNATAVVNASRIGQNLRQNSTCKALGASGNEVNYSCNITFWWWDAAGTWSITAEIKDTNNNAAINTSTKVQVASNDAFVLSPATLTWTGVSAGSTNKTATNPILLNNTGNVNTTNGNYNLSINATNLFGETTETKALWARNFSIGYEASSLGSCNHTTIATRIINASVYTNLTLVNLTAGNFTINDGTGQEQLYFCLILAGTDLSDQAYSTVKNGTWTVRLGN